MVDVVKVPNFSVQLVVYRFSVHLQGLTTDIGPGGLLGGSKLAVQSVIGSAGRTSLLGLNVETTAAGARGGGALAA